MFALPRSSPDLICDGGAVFSVGPTCFLSRPLAFSLALLAPSGRSLTDTESLITAVVLGLFMRRCSERFVRKMIFGETCVGASLSCAGAGGGGDSLPPPPPTPGDSPGSQPGIWVNAEF